MKSFLTLIFIFLILVSTSSILASPREENFTSDSSSVNKNIKSIDSGLQSAQSNLEKAFSSYRENNIPLTKEYLNKASNYLNEAAKNADSEKSKEEARELSSKIKFFTDKLNSKTNDNENNLAGLWHDIVAIIKRESDHLIHMYVDTVIAEKTMKPLLDAKMHLFRAEHDLFNSHDAEVARDDLDTALEYLEEATATAAPKVKNNIEDVKTDIEDLINNLATNNEAWKDNDVILYIDKAITELSNAKNYADPGTQIKLESIKSDINILRADIEIKNVRNKYESALRKLRNIIKTL